VTDYVPYYVAWKNLPDRSTPERAEALQVMDNGIGASARKANNLSDLDNVATARTNLGAAAASGVVGTVVYQVTDASGGVTLYNANGVEL
jgi:hypothetical protein